MVSDEIYQRIVYDGLAQISPAAHPGRRKRTHTLDGFSKSSSMTGWWLGYAAGPPQMMQTMNRVHQYNVARA